MAVKQILVIDDDDDLRNLIHTCLELIAGWRILTACSGHEGLAKAQTEQLDAILLDVMMPEMDGLNMLQQLRANPATQDIPVILLTAKGSFKNEFTSLAIRGTITKPFDPRKLAAQILAALGESAV